MTKLYIIAAALITMLAAFTATANANNDDAPILHAYEITSFGDESDDGRSTTFTDEITVTAAFDRIVSVESSDTLEIVHFQNGQAVPLTAEYDSGSGTNIIDFTYEIPLNEENNRSLTVLHNGFSAPGGVLKVTSGGSAHYISLPVFEWGAPSILLTTPQVRYVRFASSPENGHSYGVGERLVVDVEFHANLYIDEENSPSIMLALDSGDVQADYHSHSALNTLRFSYTITEDDTDTNGVGIRRAALPVIDKLDNLQYSFMPRKLPCDNHLVFESTVPSISSE